MESLTDVQINSLYHRLMSKIEKRGRVNTNMSPCWINNYKSNKHGYPTISLFNKNYYSHRFMWWYSNGKPKLKHTDVITHDCDNPNCCNPEHLKLGNAKTNMQEAIERGLVKVKTKTKSNKKGGNVKYLEGFISLKGENNNNAKLNWEKVREIRTRHSLGLTRGELKSMAIEYNVSYPLIRKVIYGTLWKE